jgi:hypothetical protein
MRAADTQLPGKVTSTTIRFRPVGLRKLKLAAWEEFRVTRQISTGDSTYVTMVHMPSWFIADELGFATGEPVNLAMTMNGVDAQRRRALVVVNASEVEDRRRERKAEAQVQQQRRETKTKRMKAMQRQARRAAHAA